MNKTGKMLLKSTIIRCFILSLTTGFIFSACKEKSNEEKIKNNPLSAHQIMNSFAEEKKWSNFSVMGSIDEYNYVYKREENTYAQVDNINTYLGIIDLKGENNREVLLDGKTSQYLGSVNSIKKSADHTIVALLTMEKQNLESSTLILVSNPDSSLSVSHYKYKLREFKDKGFVLDNVQYKLNNITFWSSIYIGKDGMRIIGEIYDQDRSVLGKAEDIFVSASTTRMFVDKMIDKIISKELDVEANSILSSFTSIDDLVEEGAQNAMRFNGKYRHKTIKLKGIVLDVDEPWLSGYKYRVKMSRCTILTNDQSIFELNKGEVGYIIGICRNFDSNSYDISVEDGRAISGKYLAEWAGHSLRESGRVADIIKENNNYELYVLDTLENPFVDEVQKQDVEHEPAVDNQDSSKEDLSQSNSDTKNEERIIEGKGFIGKYPIEMSFHCVYNKISGKYNYEGHTNYMMIDGEIHDDGSFLFYEYNDKGERFGAFEGYADFNQQKLSGTWTLGEKKLKFELGNNEMQ